MRQTLLRAAGWAERLTPALVVLLALKTAYGLLGTFDIGFDDETIYLEAGYDLGRRPLPTAETSPLFGPPYAAWYRFLALFDGDRTHVYSLNRVVLSAALPIVLYAVARRSGAPRFAAAIVAAAWSISSVLVGWPFPAHFAALVLALGALGATYAKDRLFAASIVAAAATVATYVRQELAGPTAILVVVCGVAGLYRLVVRRRASGALAASLAALPAAAGLVAFGNPLSGARAIFAFRQHYTLNVVESQKLGIDPWTNYFTISRDAFPTARTVLEAARENPHAFTWHVLRNIVSFPKEVERLLEPMAYIPPALGFGVSTALVIIVILGVIGLVVGGRRAIARLDLSRWLPLLAVVTVSAVAAAIIVYPREHYLVPAALLVLAACAAGVGALRLPLSPAAGIAAPATLSLLLALVPTCRPGRLPALLEARGTPPALVQEGFATVNALRALPLHGHVVILEPDYSRAVYARLDFERVPQWEKASGFWSFVRARHVNLIVLNDRLRDDTRFREDREFVSFCAPDGDHGDFVMFPVSGTRVVLAVRRDLLR